MKMLLWWIFFNGCPTCSNLYIRIPSVRKRCTRCGATEETLHTRAECSVAEEMWAKSRLDQPMTEDQFYRIIQDWVR